MPPSTSGGGELGGMYIGNARRPLLLTTAGAGVVAGATCPAAPVVGFAAAAGALVGDGLAGLLHAAKSVAPMVVPPTRRSSARRVSLDRRISRKSNAVVGAVQRPLKARGVIAYHRQHLGKGREGENHR